MAAVMTLGSYNLLTGTMQYEHGSWQLVQADKNWILTLTLVGKGTVANIVNAIESIDDELRAATEYIGDARNPTPVWFAVNANGENAKRALVLGGAYKPETRDSIDPMQTFSAEVGTLALQLGPWEATTATTGLSAVEFDWDDPTQAIASVPGERDARIDLVRVGVPSDGVTEQTPLVKGWIGIRPEYSGYTDFAPVWDAEYGTAGTDTAIASVADSNTSPTGSSTNNIMQCSFATTATMAKRLTIHLDEVNYGKFSLLTNGDAETGDMTGWTQVPGTDDPFAASASVKYAGSYGFYAKAEGVGAPIKGSYQQAAASEGQVIKYSFWYNDYETFDDAAQVYISFLDSGSSGLATYFPVSSSSGTTDTWRYIEGQTPAAPANTAYVRITMSVSGDTFSTGALGLDNIKLWASYTDDWIGDYLVLCRCKLVDADADATVQLQMKTGYASTTYKEPRPIVPPISHTDWKLIPLGEISFPPGRATTDDTSLYRINKMGFELWAQLLTGDTGGTDKLDIDAFIFIPSKYMLYAGDVEICRSHAPIDSGGTTYDYSYFRAYRRPDDRPAAISNAADFGGVDTNIELSMPNLYLPPGNNIVVAAFERSASHELADEFTINLTYYPRFRNRNTT